MDCPVDRLSAYKPGFRWLNPGVVGEKNNPLEKIDIYILFIKIEKRQL